MKLLQVLKLLNSLNNNTRTLLWSSFCFFVAVELLFLSFSFTPSHKPTTESVVNGGFELLIENIDSLSSAIQYNNITQQIDYYFQARQNFKRIEMVIEYVSPFFAKYYINGPPIKKHDIESGNRVFDPHGFQILESVLFAANTSFSKDELLYEVKLLRESVLQTHKKFKSVIPRSEQYFDMLQMELIRIVTLNINGYDCSITKENITETVFILEGIEPFLKSLENRNETSATLYSILKRIDETKVYLKKHSDYNKMNRLEFLVKYINPIYTLIADYRYELNTGTTPVNYAVNFGAKTLFGKSFFNRNYFSVVISDSLNIKKQAALGRNLFFDPLLSGNNKRACASCHKPEFAFADTVSFHFEYNRTGKIKRNTPALLNVMYQRNFFYDGRSLQLEDQVSDVLHAKKEMNSNPVDVVYKLKQSKAYQKLFKDAFVGSADTAITFYGVLKSIAEYEKTLVSFNSKFDRYLNGDNSALSAEEINGYTLFAGKALCGSCHFLPLFNGLMPPVFNDNEFEVIGTTQGPSSFILDADSGRFLITKKEIHLHSFKTPGLRNIYESGPYMHNGSFKTLEEVIEFYNKGGGAITKTKISNQTLPFDSLQLSKNEKADIKSFLLTLSDNPFKNTAPKKLPVINNVLLNKRKVGGEY